MPLIPQAAARGAALAESAAMDRQKSDQDLADWMPSSPEAQCRYVGEWVSTKLRRQLPADGRRGCPSAPGRAVAGCLACSDVALETWVDSGGAICVEDAFDEAVAAVRG